MKKYMNAAVVYAVLAMAGGVFFREFTKAHDYTGATTLSVIHTHYFLLGMMFFLLLAVLEKNFGFTGEKTGRALCLYHAGLNLTVIMLLVRGITTVLGTALTDAEDAMISGFAGIGHILLAAGMLLLLLEVRKSAAAQNPGA